jgi:hypothetical protein
MTAPSGGNGDQQPEDEAGNAERNRDRKAGDDEICHRLIGAERSSQVALQEIADPVEVLDGQGAIEAILLRQRIDGVGRCILAQDHRGDVAAGPANEQENGD